jgi:hypothetical protein
VNATSDATASVTGEAEAAAVPEETLVVRPWLRPSFPAGADLRQGCDVARPESAAAAAGCAEDPAARAAAGLHHRRMRRT